VRAGEFTGHGLVALLLARGVILTGVLARVARQCDTVQTPIVREHLLVRVSMKSVRSLEINSFALSHYSTVTRARAAVSRPSCWGAEVTGPCLLASRELRCGSNCLV